MTLYPGTPRVIPHSQGSKPSQTSNNDLHDAQGDPFVPLHWSFSTIFGRRLELWLFSFRRNTRPLPISGVAASCLKRHIQHTDLGVVGSIIDKDSDDGGVVERRTVFPPGPVYRAWRQDPVIVIQPYVASPKNASRKDFQSRMPT